ncbi:5415_t:CDS:2 [Funneliformis geosporum]|nr:5415_t:CDS:2 [Funneliformis geosporum]
MSILFDTDLDEMDEPLDFDPFGGSSSIGCPFFSKDINNPENKKWVQVKREYLTAIKMRCFYPNNTFTCDGQMSLQIKAGVDINLLKSLFVNQERILNQEDDTNCNKLYPSGCHQKYCDK